MTSAKIKAIIIIIIGIMLFSLSAVNGEIVVNGRRQEHRASPTHQNTRAGWAQTHSNMPAVQWLGRGCAPTHAEPHSKAPQRSVAVFSSQSLDRAEWKRWDTLTCEQDSSKLPTQTVHQEYGC